MTGSERWTQAGLWRAYSAIYHRDRERAIQAYQQALWGLWVKPGRGGFR